MPEFRLVTFLEHGQQRAGIAVGDLLYDAVMLVGNQAYLTVKGIINDWAKAFPVLVSALVEPAAPSSLLSDVMLLAPLPVPGAIYCATANYADHMLNMARKLGTPPEPNPHEVGLKPLHFIKASHTVVGPDATVSSPSNALDWEAELALVIGATARNIGAESALACVAGYVIANDLSARDHFRREPVDVHSPFAYDWIGHKSFEGSCPMGPELIPAQFVGDPQNLSIKSWVNDHLRQDSNTGKMIFSIAEQIAQLSSRITLHPGDVILTGTPAGVGAETGSFLRSGDHVRVAIDRLGELTTHIA